MCDANSLIAPPLLLAAMFPGGVVAGRGDGEMRTSVYLAEIAHLRAGGRNRRREAIEIADTPDQAALAAASSAIRRAARRVGAERLFAQDMLAGFEARRASDEMRRGRRRDHHGVDIAAKASSSRHRNRADVATRPRRRACVGIGSDQPVDRRQPANAARWRRPCLPHPITAILTAAPLPGAARPTKLSRATAEERVAKTNDKADDEDGGNTLDAKIARAELQARFYEAQIRVLEARRKLAALRRKHEDGRLRPVHRASAARNAASRCRASSWRISASSRASSASRRSSRAAIAASASILRRQFFAAPRQPYLDRRRRHVGAMRHRMGRRPARRRGRGENDTRRGRAFLAIQHAAIPEIGLAVGGKARQRRAEQGGGGLRLGAAPRLLDGAVQREVAAEIAGDIKPRMFLGGEVAVKKPIARLGAPAQARPSRSANRGCTGA